MYSDINSWSIYADKHIRIFIRPISMIANIFEFSLFPKNGLKWLWLVQNGSIWVKNNTKYENGQNSPKQSWASNLISEYIQIFWTNIFIRNNIRRFFLGQIYSDIHSWSFYHAKYIWIFIRPICMVTNIFGYSFVQKIDICPTLYWSSVKNWPQVQSRERAASQQQKNIISASCLSTHAISAQFQIWRAIREILIFEGAIFSLWNHSFYCSFRRSVFKTVFVFKLDLF